MHVVIGANYAMGPALSTSRRKDRPRGVTAPPIRQGVLTVRLAAREMPYWRPTRPQCPSLPRLRRYLAPPLRILVCQARHPDPLSASVRGLDLASAQGSLSPEPR